MADGRVKRTADNGIAQAQTYKNERGRSGQATPLTGAVSNDTNERHLHKATDARIGLKTTDDHSSWQQVYERCHIGVGMR